MKDNLVIIHGGGPTAVLNCSLYGAIREAQQSGAVEHVYGAIGGSGGMLRERLRAVRAPGQTGRLHEAL